MWIANLFSRDLYLWDSFTDHHDLVRGYILEKYFTETNPKHKLAEMRSFGGLSGAEYEADAAPRFFERYLALPDFDDTRHYLLAYELQRRYFVRDDQGQIQKIRNLAVRIHAGRPALQAAARCHPQPAVRRRSSRRSQAYRDTLPDGADARGRSTS